MYKISIIIPIYNADKFIKRCVDSILKQSFQDFELILIDDGSKDKSLKIIKDYEKKDKRVHAYTQKNSGPALTRNRGIDLAKSKYLMFIDSDDYIAKDYVEEYYNAINNTNYNVVMGGYTKIIEDKIDFIRKLNKGKFAKYIVPAPYSKIFDKKFLNDNHIRFLDTNASEDVYFNMMAIHAKAKIKCIENTGYYYYFNKNSISNTAHKGFNDKVNILEMLDKINFSDIKEIEYHQYFIIRYIIWYLLYSGKNVSKGKFLEEYNKYFAWLKVNIPNYETNKCIKFFGPDGEIKKIGFIIWMFMLLHKCNLINLFAKIYCRG